MKINKISKWTEMSIDEIKKLNREQAIYLVRDAYETNMDFGYVEIKERKIFRKAFSNYLNDVEEANEYFYTLSTCPLPNRFRYILWIASNKNNGNNLVFFKNDRFQREINKENVEIEIRKLEIEKINLEKSIYDREMLRGTFSFYGHTLKNMTLDHMNYDLNNLYEFRKIYLEDIN